MDREARTSRALPQARLRPIALALILLYAWLSAYSLLCAFDQAEVTPHEQEAHHQHQGGLHGICSWIQEIASAHLTSAVHAFPNLETLALCLIPLTLRLVASHVHRLSIRAPPLALA